MKKSFFLLSAVALLGFCFASCEKNADASKAPKGDPIQLTVNLASSEMSTRATSGVSATNEAKVNNLQVLVFIQDGTVLDAYATADDATSLTVSCTAGPRKIYAVCNAPSLASIQSEAALKATISQLSNNNLSGLEMIGNVSETLPKSATIEIPVDRLVARVVLRGVTKAFVAPALQAQTFVIDKIYMINVAKDINYGLTSAPSDWYNLAMNKNDLPALLCDAPASTVTGTYSTVHTFYVYPNPANAHSTRLVIEGTLGGVKYYWPVTMPAMEYNKSYEISSLVLNHRGNDEATGPDQDVQISDETISVSVNAWTVVPIANKGTDFVI